MNRTGWLMAAAVMTVAMLASVPAIAGEAAAKTTAGGARRIVVSVPDRKLAVIEESRIVLLLDVAVGKPATPSPIGTFTIVNRIPNPTYYRPGLVIPPGPRNPLGTRWIGINLKGYGLHGTDEPDSIGHAQSHGCIRLRNADVERLFEYVRAGDLVELHAERTPEIQQLFAR
jgi:lipoprotein-anchoring transpeptidase ErfK/SrfK